MEKKTPKSSIQSIDRAIQILKCFETNDALGVTEISRMLGLHKSTTFGLVNTLLQNKFLEQTLATGKYHLGIELFRLSANVKIGIREVSIPHVKQLVEATGETVNLVLQDDIYVVYIEKEESPHSMRICTRIGERLPMYCTAVGKAILANLEPQEVVSILDRTKMQMHTEKTLKTKTEVLADLKEIRQKGYALDNEELEYGLVCVAVPIFDASSRPVSALSISGPKQRMTDANVRSISEQLLFHANLISKKMY